MSMRNWRVLPFVFGLALSAGMIGAQSLTPGGDSDCIDSLTAAGDPCSVQQQSGQDLLRQSVQSASPSAADDMRRLRTTTSAESESSPLTQDRQPQPVKRRLPPEPLTEFQKFVAATTGQVLPILGADLFRDVPATFAPSNLAPASSQYIVGPDDELRVRIWGQINYSGNLRVDRSGNIYLPQAGSVHVSGLRFSDLDQHLRSAIGKMYRNFDLSVDLGQIRSIQVYITGQARSPGVYTMSSLSTLVNALFASGGPAPQGSLRHIILRRDGQTLTDFDLYAFLIHGDKSHDVHLLPEDVIYIPPVGPQVAALGSVRKPAIYELRDGEVLGDMLAAAGGATSMASSARISLERTADRQNRTAIEVSSDKSGLSATLNDGDIVRVFSIIPAYTRVVTLRGRVANPGRFSWHEGMRLTDVIPDQDSLVSRDYWWNRSHLGFPGEEFEPAIATIGADPRHPESTSRGFTDAVTQQTLKSALTSVSDPTEVSKDSPTPRAVRMGSSGSLAEPLNKTEDPERQMSKQPKTKIQIRLATSEINWNYAAIERTDPETLKTSLIPFDLGKLVLQHDASQNFPVEPGDVITIFSQDDIRVPIDQQTKYVSLEGEFAHSGVYSVQPGETLQDIVRRAGGLTARAYLFGAEFDRESTRVLQQQRINEYVRSVSMEAERGTQALAVSGSISGGGASEVSASRAVTDQLIARLNQVRATGRIVLQLRPSSSSVNDLPVLGLENGDRFVVPPTPDTINVVGAVYDQNSFIYVKGRDVAFYLKLAGGPTRNADKGHAFVIRADGSVISRPAVQSGWSYFGGNGFNSLRLFPGDTVVVPDKTLRPTALRSVLDWTQVFSQVALGAAAINVLQ
jgi:protein involved in polysaccharide export with SLBB domain